MFQKSIQRTGRRVIWIPIVVTIIDSTFSINIYFHRSVDRSFAPRVARALARSRLQAGQDPSTTHHARAHVHPLSFTSTDIRAVTVCAICACVHAACDTFFSHKMWFIVSCSSNESKHFVSIIQKIKEQLENEEIKTHNEAVAAVSHALRFVDE